MRLKETLDDRNREVEQITNKNSKQRQALEDNIHYLQKDC